MLADLKQRENCFQGAYVPQGLSHTIENKGSRFSETLARLDHCCEDRGRILRWRRENGGGERGGVGERRPTPIRRTLQPNAVALRASKRKVATVGITTADAATAAATARQKSIMDIQVRNRSTLYPTSDKRKGWRHGNSYTPAISYRLLTSFLPSFLLFVFFFSISISISSLSLLY